MKFNDLEVLRGTAFDPRQGVRAIDNVDGDLTESISIEGQVNASVVGEYTLKYSVVDSSGNKTEASRKVTVVDSDGPRILGAENCEVEFGAEFDVTSGVTAVDDVDGDVTESLVIEGTVDTSVVGPVKVTYKAYDSVPNEVIHERIVTVVDNVAPVLSGVEDIQISHVKVQE